MSNRLSALLAVLLVAASQACSGDPCEEVSVDAAAAMVASKNPFADVEPPREGDERLRGTIIEILPAGSYTYAAVQPEHGDARWVVTMRRGFARGDDVEVKNMGVQREFYSKRLRRTFDELIFGVVRSAPATRTEG